MVFREQVRRLSAQKCYRADNWVTISDQPCANCLRRLAALHGPGAEQIAGDHNQGEESQTCKGKDLDECAALARVFPDVDSVVDNRGQGADEAAKSGAVHAVEQGGQVLGKGVEHNGRRDIGDGLAQQNPPPVFPPPDRSLQESGDGRVTGDRGGENEKAKKGDQQHIVSFQQSFSVENENRQKYQPGDIDPQICAADNGEKDQGKEQDVQHPVFFFAPGASVPPSVLR